MLFREVIAVYCENPTRRINEFCGDKTEFSNIKVGGLYSHQCALNV
jgi:hypothetical protein